MMFICDKYLPEIDWNIIILNIQKASVGLAIFPSQGETNTNLLRLNLINNIGAVKWQVRINVASDKLHMHDIVIKYNHPRLYLKNANKMGDSHFVVLNMI